MKPGPEHQSHIVAGLQRFLAVLRIRRPRALCGYLLPALPDWETSLPPCPECAEYVGWVIRPEMRTA